LGVHPKYSNVRTVEAQKSGSAWVRVASAKE
jgi:hypothetical protein